ncbi:uncharacterized protein LOC110214126 isoform X2 [Phascolarctos cinereus]|uniref:Mating-type protein A-alpha Z4-like isoform X2 n=1 Tax=Phascolarctos cinereus TaxID=38626 RepID=A0A6P5L129_PHACI|nr:mating-type protein A-alpha Z4-like isoform X2 [Phascolarctos cinereus]
MAPSPRFLLPVSLLILLLALVAAVEDPLSNKRTLQTEDENEGNGLESESLDNPDSDSSQNFAGEDAGSEETADMEDEAEENEEDESPFQKKAQGL